MLQTNKEFSQKGMEEQQAIMLSAWKGLTADLFQIDLTHLDH